MQKRLSKSPETFGKGNPEGVVAAETANNACMPGALAPMLALGIPGKASTAVLVGALAIQGVRPGPLIFTQHPEIPYSIYIALLVGMPFMVMLGLFGSRLWVRLTTIPSGIVTALVCATCLLGTFSEANDIFAITVAVAFGIIGYLLSKVEIEPAPIVLALGARLHDGIELPAGAGDVRRRYGRVLFAPHLGNLPGARRHHLRAAAASELPVLALATPDAPRGRAGRIRRGHIVSEICPRRSVLYVPGGNARMLEKTRQLDADAVIIDLEDSVAPDVKPQARALACAAVAAGDFGFREVAIRLNPPTSTWFLD